MARKSEIGIEYFPLNTDIIHNPKIKLVVAEYGPKAYAVLFPLYCKIYREKGYWIDWMDEDSKLLFAQDESKCELSFVNEVVTGCIRRGLFDRTVFDSFGVLTSDRIQENFLEAKKRNTEVVFIEQFIAKSDDVNIYRDNVNIIPLNVNILSKKVYSGTQREKENENRIKKEGEGESADALLSRPGKGIKSINETSGIQRELKKEYSILAESLTEKPKVDVWNELKNFILVKKPEFIEPFVDAWNIFADTYKLEKVGQITTKRKTKFSNRMREKSFDFFAILKGAQDSKFLKGENDRGWQIDFNFIIESEDNYVKILEGKYK